MGGRMNFLSEPNQVIQPDANMSDEEVQVAGAFVDELIDLHVVNTPEVVWHVLTNTPLFVVPKEGQPGEWGVIDDMLHGIQNAHIGSDPVYLPRISHILNELYGVGYSSVIGSL